MVKLFKNRLYLTGFLFIIVFILSILSKWLNFLDFGIFNYSILLLIALFIPNFSAIYKELENSEIEKIKLPFCELKLLKKYDYYFIGNKTDEEINDLVLLGFYEDVFNKDEAFDKFKEEFPNQENFEIVYIVKQVHYKKND